MSKLGNKVKKKVRIKKGDVAHDHVASDDVAHDDVARSQHMIVCSD